MSIDIESEAEAWNFSPEGEMFLWISSLMRKVIAVCAPRRRREMAKLRRLLLRLHDDSSYAEYHHLDIPLRYRESGGADV